MYDNTTAFLGVVAGEKLAPTAYVCGDPCKSLDFAPRAATIAAQTLSLNPMPAPAVILATLAAVWVQAGDGFSARPITMWTNVSYFEVFPCTILPSAPDCSLMAPSAVSYRVMLPAVYGDHLLRSFAGMYRYEGPPAHTIQSGGVMGACTAQPFSVRCCVHVARQLRGSRCGTSRAELRWLDDSVPFD